MMGVSVMGRFLLKQDTERFFDLGMMNGGLEVCWNDAIAQRDSLNKSSQCAQDSSVEKVWLIQARISPTSKPVWRF